MKLIEMTNAEREMIADQACKYWEEHHKGEYLSSHDFDILLDVIAENYTREKE